MKLPRLLIIGTALILTSCSVLPGPKRPMPPPTKAPEPTIRAKGSLTLFGPQEAQIGREFLIEVNLKTEALVDGVDVVLQFNPKILEAKAASPSALFPTYPFIKFDNQNGRAEVSAATKINQPFKGEGSLVTVSFVPKTPGETLIILLAEEENTTDSNIAEHQTGRDLLTEGAVLSILVLR